ncbi:unnamed protein product [Pleuronectes platessa]|uniref:Uncharacterized protein n=1 Tax=Pleuronectes platessa TaxID=8262 RepID=A0A9N7YU04_PLEPL|nr:unnamed protein product [Pleuronectes platessa]
MVYEPNNGGWTTVRQGRPRQRNWVQGAPWRKDRAPSATFKRRRIIFPYPNPLYYSVVNHQATGHQKHQYFIHLIHGPNTIPGPTSRPRNSRPRKTGASTTTGLRRPPSTKHQEYQPGFRPRHLNLPLLDHCPNTAPAPTRGTQEQATSPTHWTKETSSYVTSPLHTGHHFSPPPLNARQDQTPDHHNLSDSDTTNHYRGTDRRPNQVPSTTHTTLPTHPQTTTSTTDWPTDGPDSQ